jgi:hypothetical protein
MQKGAGVAVNGVGLQMARRQSEITSFGGRGRGWGCLKIRLKDMELCRQVYLGHVLKVFREPIRGFYDMLKLKPTSLLIL